MISLEDILRASEPAVQRAAERMAQRGPLEDALGKIGALEAVRGPDGVWTVPQEEVR